MDKESWEKVEALFHVAEIVPPMERAAFLDAQCEGDEDLRRSVESLLEHAQKDTELDVVVQQAAQSLLNTGQDLSGKRLGPYLVTGELGKGGMGAVYLAQRADEQYRQQVAIKVIRAGATSAEVMQRFRVERQILANLEHPYIARLLDGGTTEAGLPYLVMEYIEGEPIDVYCNRNKLGVPERLRLFQKVCSAVQYAHQKLVIHRDLKPSNLLVTNEGEPRLLDFGIAKLLDRSDADQTIVETRAETRLLTPQYSSPEQIRGKPVSTVTDVYALGVILYELITGKRPYGKADTDRYSIEQAVLATDPVRPSTSVVQEDIESCVGSENRGESGNTLDWCGELHPKQLRRQLAGDLDNIVLMALRKEPDRRYQSVAQFSEDIDLFLEQRPVFARPTSWRYRSSKFLARHRFSSALGSLLLLAIVGFSLVTWMQSKTVALERDLAQQERAKAEAISGFLTNMFSEVEPDRAQGREIRVREVLDRASAQLEQNSHPLISQPAVEAVVHRIIGGIYTDLGILPPAEAHLERALEIHRVTKPRDQEEFLLTLMDLGNLYHLQFREEERLALSIQAVELSEQIYGADHARTLGAINNLAGIYQMMGKLGEAEKLYAEVYAKRRAALGEDHRDTLNSIISLGVNYQWSGEFAKSVGYFQLCLAQSRNQLGDNHTQTLDCMQALGSVLETMGEYAAAEPVIAEHIERATLILGEDHPTTLRSMHNLADTYRGLDRFAESETLFLKTLEARRQVLGESHIETLQTQMKLARLLRLMKRYAEAEPLVKGTVERQRLALGFEHPTTLIAAQELADLFREEGRIEDALALYHSVLQAREKVLGEAHPELHNTLVGLGRIYLDKTENAEAEIYLQRALKLADQNPDFRSQDIAEVLRMLIQLYESIGFPEQAAPYRERLAMIKGK